MIDRVLKLGCVLVVVSLMAEPVHATRKVVSFQLCVIDNDDHDPHDHRKNPWVLWLALAVKNSLWAKCGIVFRPQRAVIIDDPVSPPSNISGDVLQPRWTPLSWGHKSFIDGRRPKGTNKGRKEYNKIYQKCNQEFGPDAKAKITEILIRRFVNKNGLPNRALSKTKNARHCRMKTNGSKPMIIDPSFFRRPGFLGFISEFVNFGRSWAHANGKGLYLKQSGWFPRWNLMNPKVWEPDVRHALHDRQCNRALRHANQKIGSTVDKDLFGIPVAKAGPRTRTAVDPVDDTPEELGAIDIIETDVTYQLGNHDLSVQILLRDVLNCDTSAPGSYHYVFDLDNDPGTGGTPNLPFAHIFQGAELVSEASVDCHTGEVSVRTMRWNGGGFELVADSSVEGGLTTMWLNVSTGTIEGEEEEPGIHPYNDVLSITLPEHVVDPVPVEDFRVQAFAFDPATGIVDEGTPVHGSLIPYPEPTLITLEPPTGPAGTELRIDGEAFEPSQPVTIFAGTTQITTIQSQADGTFSTTFIMPDLELSHVPVMAVAGVMDELMDRAASGVVEITADVVIFDVMPSVEPCAQDADCDGVGDEHDNCPSVPNPLQPDADQDEIGDDCDNCDPADPQADADGDSVCADFDNCPDVPNPHQTDFDGDDVGDACDVCPHNRYNDVDEDGVCNDNCPTLFNPGQTDNNADGFGDLCVKPDVDLQWGVTIGPNPSIGEAVVLESEVTIGEDVQIGDRVHIMSGARIGRGTIIEDDVLIGPNVRIGDHCRVGRGVAINANSEMDDDTIIGAESAVGTHTHIGANVTIGQNVQIYDLANIGDGCQLENEVYLGSSDLDPDCHLKRDSYVGFNNRILSSFTLGENAAIGNSTTIDPGVTIGENRVIRDGVRLGTRVSIGAVDSELRHVLTIGYGVTVGHDTHIGPNSELFDDVMIGNDAEIGAEVRLWSRVQIGHEASIGAGSALGSGVIVGDATSMGPGSQLWEATRVGTGNTFGNAVTIKEGCVVLDGVTLGGRVYVGRDSIIGSGVVLADDEYVAAGTMIEF